MDNKILTQLFEIMGNTDIQEITFKKDIGLVSIATETRVQDYYKGDLENESKKTN